MTELRICGWRKWGKTYFENYIVRGENVYQMPLDAFLICPPWPVDLQAIELSTQGMSIIERPDMFGKGTGIYDLWDYVGLPDKVYAVDYIEEARHLGTSRLVPEPVLKSEKFKLLKPDVSSHIFVSNKALLTQKSAEKLQAHRIGIHDCPANLDYHKDMKKGEVLPCLALNWEAVETAASSKTAREWWVPVPRCANPTFAYKGATALKSWKIEFEGPAMFMALPLLKSELAVIEDPITHEETDTLKMLADIEAQFPYKMAKE